MLYNFSTDVFVLNLQNSEFNSIRRIAFKNLSSDCLLEKIQLSGAEFEELKDYFEHKLEYQCLEERAYIIVNNLMVFQIDLNEKEEIIAISAQLAAYYSLESHKKLEGNNELVLLNDESEAFKEDLYQLLDICNKESQHNEKASNDVGFMDGSIKDKLKALIEKYYENYYKLVFDNTEKTIIINGWYVFHLVEKQQHMWYGTVETIEIA